MPTDEFSYRIKFVILLTLQIPSVIASLIVFIHFASSRALRASDRQHSLIVLLVINFVQVLIDVPMALDFYRFGGIVRLQTSAYCLWWIMIDYSLFALSALLMAWISIERHLLIFHRQLLGGAGSWRKCLLQVAPWIICLLWDLLFYTVTVLISPMCTNTWSFNAILCGQPCYVTTNWGSVDIFINAVFPIVVIIIADLALVIRVIDQRKAVTGRASVDWRRHRKMVLQLAAISTLFLSVWFPIGMIQIVRLYIDPTFLYSQLDTFNFLAFVEQLILPAVCMAFIPQLFKRLKKILMRRHGVVVAQPM